MDFMAVCKLVLGDVCAVDDDGVGVTEADAVGAGVLLAVDTGVLLAVGAGVLLTEVDVERYTLVVSITILADLVGAEAATTQTKHHKGWKS